MSAEVKLTSGRGSMAERIADRLKPSNDLKNAEVIARHGSGPTRTVTTIHCGNRGPLGGKGEER